jgi:BirA family biotin operon repressor/biotin-[acetyl-CoA-carboxylase] ligase
MKNDGAGKIIQLYNTVLYKRNEKVKLKKSIAVFETIIKEVKSDGLLITEDTMQREFNFGDVEWV